MKFKFIILVAFLFFINNCFAYTIQHLNIEVSHTNINKFKKQYTIQEIKHPANNNLPYKSYLVNDKKITNITTLMTKNGIIHGILIDNCNNLLEKYDRIFKALKNYVSFNKTVTKDEVLYVILMIILF